MLFNEQGLIDIDEMIMQEASFQNIMADDMVTEEELAGQSQKVVELLHEAENRFNDEDLQFVKRLFAETNVLTAIYHFYELQNLNHHVSL